MSYLLNIICEFSIMKPRPNLISIVIPVHNESPNLREVYNALSKVQTELKDVVFEYVFVDDGSVDDSMKILMSLQKQDKKIQIIELSRNFGKEVALTAGLHKAAGEAVIMLDADMQHPMEVIPLFVDKWRSGAEVVVGVRKNTEGASLFRNASSWLFYKLLNRIADRKIVPHSTDFRLLDRAVVREFNMLTEHHRITRGLIDWLGFRKDYVYFEAPRRLHGKASYGIRKLFELAMHSFVSFSMFPLRLAGWLGIVITCIAGLGGGFIIIEDFLLKDPLNLNFSGPALLAVINMFFIGIVLMSIGLVALYIAQIHTEVINRPLYVVRRRSRIASKPGRRPKV